jgi:DNA-binding transcriptional LysR family regulator
MGSLPPLNALRAFEAAARHLSFQKAAGELCVTSGAISHQVKALEAHLGVKLFRRLPQSLELTDDGRALYPELRSIFDSIKRVIDRVDSGHRRRRLSVSVVTTFALSWLAPRLWQFNEAHPELNVCLMASVETTDFAHEDVDVAIRYGRGPWPGLRQDKLCDDTFTPLCGRRWRKPLSNPNDLVHVPLLGIKAHDHWGAWLRQADISDIRCAPAQLYDSSRIAIDAAICGAGVAIGNPHLHAGLLKAKWLYQPFDLAAKNGDGYWIVCPEESIQRPHIVAFRDWLLATTEYLRSA